MNNYCYSQRYSVYANYGIGKPTMKTSGCVITCLAMILSYFNDRAYYPEQMLKWGREHGMLDSRGRTNFSKFCEATGNKLRISTYPNTRPGEKVYGIREVKLRSGLLHWIIDSPTIPNKVIDSFDGQVKDFSSFNYTGRVYYYIGKK